MWIPCKDMIFHLKYKCFNEFTFISFILVHDFLRKYM